MHGSLNEASGPGPEGDVRARMEDHALTSVPDSERRSGWGLMTNTAGIASTLIQLAIGGGVTLIAGVGYGILAGVLVAVFGGVLGWLVGHVAYKSGTSSTVTARFYGLGVRGSAIASLIFAFMILGFLALENALLYYGTLFMFGWSPSTGNAILIYGVLTLVWTEFGRRAKENGSGGTDHGAAGTGFLIGTRAAGTQVGEFPVLAGGLDDDGNLKATADFRAVYASLLEQWLQFDAARIIPQASRFARPTLVK